MNRVARQDRRKTALIEHGDRRPAPVTKVWAPRRPRTSDQGSRLILMSGEDDETAPAPLRVGESRRHGMPPIQPSAGAGGLAAGFGHAHLPNRCETAADTARQFQIGSVSTGPD
jgi:hypothetical protein